MPCLRPWLGTFAVLALLPLVSLAQETGKPLTLIDSAGKEIGLQNWKFSTGTKHLSWLDGKAPALKKGKTVPAGPEYLEFREVKAVMYKEDVTTYLPLSSLKLMEYDHKAKEVKVTFLGGNGKETTLRGSTVYAGINKYNLDGDISAGTLTVGGSVKLLDGSLRADIQAIRFPEPRGEPLPFAPDATVLVRGKEKTRHEMQELRPLFKATAGYRLLPFLVFQKTVKMDLAEIVRLTHLPPKDKKGGVLDFEIEKRDGSKQGLTLLEKVGLDEKETAVLVGLVGRVPAGYRLFPASIIEEVTWKAEGPKKIEKGGEK